MREEARWEQKRASCRMGGIGLISIVGILRKDTLPSRQGSKTLSMRFIRTKWGRWISKRVLHHR